MKKVILLFAGLMIAAIFVQSVAAASYTYNGFYYADSHRPHVSYHYDGYVNKGDACISFNRHGCSHGYPRYRYNHIGSFNPFDHDSDDDKRAAKRAIVRWTDQTFNERYSLTAGRSSADAFGGDSEDAVSGSNFRYRNAYNPRTDGQDRNDYYYRTGIDEDLGYVNWRY